MSFRCKILILLLFQACIFLRVSAQEKGPSVLFIGNSFTFGNDMPVLFNSLAKSMGINCYVSSYTQSGQRISGHLKDPMCFESIRYRQWDYIVVQDLQALYTDSVGKFPPGLIDDNIRFQDSIKSLVPCAKVIYFAGWEILGGRKDIFPKDNTNSMLQRIMKNYVLLNDHPHVKNVIAPVGAAWGRCLKERPDITLYSSDERHPHYPGSYLTAAMFISLILDRNPESATFQYFLDKYNAAYLRRLAWNTLKDTFSFTNIQTIRPEIRIDTARGVMYTSDHFNRYQWFRNGKPISGATSPSCQVNCRKALYSLQAWNDRNCGFESGTVQIEESPDTTCSPGNGIANSGPSAGQEFEIFPNPASGSITVVNRSGTQRPLTVRIMNATGQEVALWRTTDINDMYNFSLAGLKTGVYLIEIQCGQNRTVKKLMVN